MLRLIIFTIKMTVLSVVIVLLSLIPVDGKRVSEHVLAFTRDARVQKPIQWISERVDFTSGLPKQKETSRTSRLQRVQRAAPPVSKPERIRANHEVPEADAAQLSGVLKTHRR